MDPKIKFNSYAVIKLIWKGLKIYLQIRIKLYNSGGEHI
jgi:hypothetical protein